MTLCTDEFARSAQTAAAALGLPGLPLAVLGHPLANLTADEAGAKAATAVDEILEALTLPADTLDARYRSRHYPNRRPACPR